MTRYRVLFLRRAKREYALALAWWRQNRPAAPTLLRGEARAARKLLAEQPYVGAVDPQHALRRLLLTETGYHFYYRIHEDERVVEILAIWHVSRDTPRI